MSLTHPAVLPYSEKFPAALESYCEQMRVAVAKNAHHDQRRSLLLNFLREGMGIESTEIELERKTKAAEVRGLDGPFLAR